ncbi:MAG: hypothetical protein GWO24_25800, partial [Akkermansiaceae bacterium]|nr:hypothetical protein [Akkermansiaceae bacterium]
HGALFVDLDNDGDQDLVLAQPAQVLALRNTGGARFELAYRFPAGASCVSVSAADHDLDGDLDLYV